MFFPGRKKVVTTIVSATPVGATLMKTGQTTSYRAGDDGDIEAGRATNFTTLAVNNPFGNTNRFTDELGGQTYTNNIVIDWSTYDTVGGTVLGYLRTVYFDTYANIETALNSLNVSGFTGWRIPNINEVFNIANKGAVAPFNYSPLNISLGVYFFSSTLMSSNVTYAMANLANFVVEIVNVGSARGATPVRLFTVSGTTLS